LTREDPEAEEFADGELDRVSDGGLDDSREVSTLVVDAGDVVSTTVVDGVEASSDKEDKLDSTAPLEVVVYSWQVVSTGATLLETMETEGRGMDEAIGAELVYEALDDDAAGEEKAQKVDWDAESVGVSELETTSDETVSWELSFTELVGLMLTAVVTVSWMLELGESGEESAALAVSDESSTADQLDG
jgi:hypothetical protein